MEGFTVGPAALHLLNNRSFYKKVAALRGISPQRGCLTRRNPIWRQHLASAHPPLRLRRSTRMTGPINMTPCVTLLFPPLSSYRNKTDSRGGGASRSGWGCNGRRSFWRHVLHIRLRVTCSRVLGCDTGHGWEEQLLEIPFLCVFFPWCNAAFGICLLCKDFWSLISGVTEYFLTLKKHNFYKCRQ